MRCLGRRLSRVVFAVLLLCFSRIGLAQSTNSGDIRGTVTDSTGALIPGVAVTVVNVDTNVSKNYITNQDGLYDTSSIVTGHYKLTFSKQSFETFVRGPITLEVGNTTVNAILNVGSSTQQVVVTSDVPLLQTESAEQSTTLESQTLSQLPQTGDGASWYNFTVLFPGFAGSAPTPQGSSNPGQYVSANGNLPYINTLSDGASTTTDQSQNAVPDTFETIAEVQVSTSVFSAQYGLGGIVFNQITKSGTSQFHGAVYDYFQNNTLNAAQFGFLSKPTVPFIRYNEFGGSIGGPILKKKMFFFFNYDQIVDHGAASNTTSSIPTAGVMNGVFSGERTIYDPTTQTIAYDAKGNPYPVRKSFESEYGSNAIPSGLFDGVAAKFQQFYPSATNHISGGKFIPGSVGADGEIQNNFYSSIPQSNPNKAYFGRLDYDIIPSNRLTASVQEYSNPAVYASAITASPIGWESGDVDNNHAQLTDVWNISSRTINEARMGTMIEQDYFKDLALGQNYSGQLGWQFAKADTIPGVQFTNTNPYTNIQPAVGFILKSQTFDPSDVITMIRGKHVIHVGGEFLFYREDSTAYGYINAGTLQFSGRYTQQWVVDPSTGIASPDTQTGLEYADFLLGYAQNWSAAVSPEYGGRLKSPQMFVQDDFKVRPNLTLNLGLRYQINHGWNEVHGNMASFDPSVPNPATGTLGAYWYGSTHANGRSSLQANEWNILLPRLGFSWLVDPNTTLRGGWGMYSQLLNLNGYGGNNTSYGIGAAISSSGNVSDQTNGITPITKLDGSGTLFGTNSPLPYTSTSTDSTKYNGQAVGYIQYHNPVPKVYQWNLAVQRQLGSDYVGELAYVASHGFNLPFLTDLNQVPETQLSPNDSAYRPYPQYQGISGSTNNAISNYNSLQASITKRMTDGFSFSFNYVWSHFLDDQDSAGRGSFGGPNPFQLATDPSASYSNSNFDVRNAFKGYAVYQLPFGKGKAFLNKRNVLDPIIGGWQLSGTLILSSGNPFTVYGTQNTFALAGSAFPNWNPGVSPRPQHRSARCEVGSGSQYGCINEWYDPAAFSRPADGTFGNVRRNSLYGPGINLVNLSGGKTFSLPWESLKLQIRADATNAFNHASFQLPTGILSGAASVGNSYTWTPGLNAQQITATTVGGRSVQLTAHLTF
jgi:Carboxypeptidase regulatory-like domain